VNKHIADMLAKIDSLKDVHDLMEEVEKAKNDDLPF